MPCGRCKASRSAVEDFPHSGQEHFRLSLPIELLDFDLSMLVRLFTPVKSDVKLAWRISRPTLINVELGSCCFIHDLDYLDKTSPLPSRLALTEHITIPVGNLIRTFSSSFTKEFLEIAHQCRKDLSFPNTR